MANAEHLSILRQDVAVWNQWRKANRGIIPDLHEGDLTSANLRGADLHYTNLTSANLFNADLRYADFIYANLRRADLRAANLSEADLRHADLSEAEIGWTLFGDVDLSEVKGLETINHKGPSTIGIDTIYQSKGNIPHKFLLAAGVPKEAIDYLLPLAGKAIYYSSCFISYSSKDETLARRLYNDLQGHGVPVFFAPEDLKIGAETRQAIDRAIHLNEKLLLILSKHSIESAWVQKEVETAFEKESSLKKQYKIAMPVLFPISIDTAVMKSDYAWAADIRRMRNIGDFTKWKDHDAYQKAFDRLLRDLKTEEKK